MSEGRRQEHPRRQFDDIEQQREEPSGCGSFFTTEVCFLGRAFPCLHSLTLSLYRYLAARAGTTKSYRGATACPLFTAP